MCVRVCECVCRFACVVCVCVCFFSARVKQIKNTQSETVCGTKSAHTCKYTNTHTHTLDFDEKQSPVSPANPSSPPGEKFNSSFISVISAIKTGKNTTIPHGEGKKNPVDDKKKNTPKKKLRLLLSCSAGEQKLGHCTVGPLLVNKCEL